MDVDYQVITSKKKYFLLLPDNSVNEFMILRRSLQNTFKQLRSEPPAC
jgi:hypothetical protein